MNSIDNPMLGQTQRIERGFGPLDTHICPHCDLTRDTIERRVRHNNEFMCDSCCEYADAEQMKHGDFAEILERHFKRGPAQKRLLDTCKELLNAYRQTRARPCGRDSIEENAKAVIAECEANS